MNNQVYISIIDKMMDQTLDEIVESGEIPELCSKCLWRLGSRCIVLNRQKEGNDPECEILDFELLLITRF